MSIFKIKKKTGFTLMEVAIAVMIVALLVLICVPVVQNQLSKSDEYSYYLAYRSVEKMGGQIVALGDPDDTYYTSDSGRNYNIADNSSQNFLHKIPVIDSVKITFDNWGKRLVYTEQFLLKNMFPKTFASGNWDGWTNYHTIEGSNFDDIQRNYKVCKLHQKIKNEQNPTNADGSTRYWTCEELISGSNNIEHEDGSHGGAVTSSSYFDDHAPLKSLLPSSGCKFGEDETNINSAYNNLDTVLYTQSFSNFCEKMGEYCNITSGSTEYKVDPTIETVSEYDEEDGHTDTMEYCHFYSKTTSSSSSSSSATTPLERPKVTNICIKSPYFGMENTAGDYALNCECVSGKYTTQNNDKVCCPFKSGYSSYARSDISTGMSESTYCKYCTGDFDSVHNWCCPSHSVFNGSECQCVEGYDMDSATKGTSSEFCHKTKCAKGSHLDEDTEVCVPNPPIVKSSRFCELIASNWNLAPNSSNCSTFTKVNNVNVYQSVLDAAKGNSGSGYLSINSQQGAFNSITPNAILANGLKLWILGDKAASIPGLSYNPLHVTSTQNMCRELLNGTKPLSTKALCDAASGYFCKGEAHCYTLDSASLAVMGDARNCCASTDLSTISYDTNFIKDNRTFAVGGFTVFVDINGSKGSGTLWEDVFPFYIGSNGRVYPGYPLDAPKEKSSTSNSLYLGGNSVKNLPVDVFYYESQGNKRKKITAFSNVSYARGVCFGKLINAYTPYCQNLGLKVKGGGTDISKVRETIESSSNPCSNHSCFVSVRKKHSFF